MNSKVVEEISLFGSNSVQQELDKEPRNDFLSV